MGILIAGLDLETSGLDYERGHRIVEIAMSIYDFDPVAIEFTKKGAFTQRINPQRPIDPGAQAVHGISYEEVAMCPIWEDIAPKVVKIMSATKIIVAHNGDGFDLPFITHELLRVGCAIPNIRTVDTMLASRWASPGGKYPTLGELCFATNTPYDPSQAHAALYDVDCMMSAFFKAHKKGFIKLPQIH